MILKNHSSFCDIWKTLFVCIDNLYCINIICFDFSKRMKTIQVFTIVGIFSKFYQVLIIYQKTGTFSDVFLHWSSSKNMISACKRAGFSLMI